MGMEEDKKAILGMVLTDFSEEFNSIQYQLEEELNQKLYGLIKKALEHPETTWKLNQVFHFMMNDLVGGGIKWDRNFFCNAAKFIYHLNSVYNDFVLYETSNRGWKTRFVVKRCVRKQPKFLSVDGKPKRCLMTQADVIRFIEAIVDIDNYDKASISRMTMDGFKDNDEMNKIVDEMFAKPSKRRKSI